MSIPGEPPRPDPSGLGPTEPDLVDATSGPETVAWDPEAELKKPRAADPPAR